MVAAPKKKPEDLIIKQIHIRLNKNDYYELKKMCLEEDITINSFVKNLIKNAINRKSDK
ncbi:hypothetical protein [Spiroplasma endosymbiont of Danaus chrysippus]|uniref:hypothetical protein n=1 Tax=Spiroplasma endosymbiont of Danaus chrysippus TaxID=2691041 RepID=UPI0013C73E22|nr:hypothetical protein [Spiroplasma endosymbiont of Danaus chrysippus]CAB1054089.1 hypothetical protein [Spiroplasma endosymbiont of Danaus chrysippus]CAB1054762.1 hypothetical protein [Spiroplasma endosymbiont of Danaus chrysippus]